MDLRAVMVRPNRGGRKHRLWDRLIEEHHCLRFHGIVGKGPRHVALYGETWLALVGWQPGAFKLAARDRWIGWSQEQQFRPAPGLQQLPFRHPHPRTGAEPGVPRSSTSQARTRGQLGAHGTGGTNAAGRGPARTAAPAGGVGTGVSPASHRIAAAGLHPRAWTTRSMAPPPPRPRR